MSIFLKKNRAFLTLILGLTVVFFSQFLSWPISNRAPTRPTSTDSAQVALGKLLFYEPALSGNYKRSCSSCHRPLKAFTDHRRKSLAFQFTENVSFNAPTLLNSGQLSIYFHDGRFSTIDQVIDFVVNNPAEFKCNYDTIVARLNQSQSYRSAFIDAFPSQPRVCKSTINRALVAFTRSLKSNNSAFDVWQKNNCLPINDRVSAGYQLFIKPNSCAGCHAPPFFGSQTSKKRVPSLRNVAVTPPYFQTGTVAELSEAMQQCGAKNSPESIHWDQKKWRAVEFFLQALTDTTTADKTEPTTLPFIPSAPRRNVGGIY